MSYNGHGGLQADFGVEGHVVLKIPSPHLDGAHQLSRLINHQQVSNVLSTTMEVQMVLGKNINKDTRVS